MKTKSAYVCSECGYRSAKWLGKCPSCMQWNTMEEELIEQTPQKRLESVSDGVVHSQRIGELGMPDYMRVRTGVDELDRVLGGGFVTGSVVLAAGEPGIGKSTLLMQISASVGKNHKVLYVSGEESGWQLKYRAKRLGLDSSEFYILTETNMNRIMWELEKIAPDFLILDSIQTVYDEASSSTPGSTTQVRENTSKIINYAKNCGMTVIIVGHVNKEGGIAGPKVLEHMVDAVLYFEGERRESFRIIRAIKNRYGSTGEIGVFQMTDKGLEEVSNPSEMLLSSRPSGVSGNCPACVIEGTRPIIAEIQALSANPSFSRLKEYQAELNITGFALFLQCLKKGLGFVFLPMTYILTL
ncbi:MAG: DNA repair protein RadA [Clostridia bacterium]|nr:DNA repair protein RadA [Clostridia bacterium]